MLNIFVCINCKPQNNAKILMVIKRTGNIFRFVSVILGKRYISHHGSHFILSLFLSRIGEKKLTDYQRRCNSFFMDVVSQLCFYDNTPPSDEVIDKLLKYIFYTSERRRKVQGTNRTKEMTIFDTGLDPNPVFRSFLLQLLMRTRFGIFFM